MNNTTCDDVTYVEPPNVFVSESIGSINFTIERRSSQPEIRTII